MTNKVLVSHSSNVWAKHTLQLHSKKAETYNFKYEANPKNMHYISFVGFEEVLSQHWNYFSLKFFDDDVSGVEN